MGGGGGGAWGRGRASELGISCLPLAALCSLCSWAEGAAKTAISFLSGIVCCSRSAVPRGKGRGSARSRTQRPPARARPASKGWSGASATRFVSATRFCSLRFLKALDQPSRWGPAGAPSLIRNQPPPPPQESCATQ